MNPPHGPDLLIIPTINLMITITLFMQGMLIGLSTRVIRSYKGVWAAAIATMALAASFLVITIVPPELGIVKAYSSQFLFICGYALIYLAICRFTNKSFKKWILFGLVPLSLLALTISIIIPIEPPPLKFVSVFAGFLLSGSSALTLWTSEHQRYKLSAYLTTLTLGTFSLVMLWQLIASFFSADVLLPVGTSAEKYFNLSLFIVSYLWTGGFILMVSQRLQSDLNDLAMNDALTRVRNRRAMDKLLKFEMERVQKDVKDFSIILGDIDHFKRVNDTYGHDIGDKVLQWFASTLQGSLRVQDVVARWGGEEFLILLPDTNLDEAEQVAERLREIVESSRVDAPEETIRITFSAGIASSTTNRDVKNLCKVADQALYVAKQTRNCVITQDKIQKVK